MHETLVDCRNVGKTYLQGTEPLLALSGVTVTVRPGDLVALVGPSGGGKSTLLQLMGGLDVPTTGEITWPVLGERTALRPRQIGYVFQTQSLVDPLSVVENVELPLLLLGEPSAAARLRAREALAALNLEALAAKLPEELSGGQAQRVAVARALVGRPKLLLADEPTGKLDHSTAEHLMEVLVSAVQASGAALIVATHDPGVVERLPLRWHLSHGRLEVAS